MVELTSPTTTTQSGFSCSHTVSNPVMILAVCTACDPEPTPKLMSGGRMPSSRKKTFGHGLVVVLAGVNQARLHGGTIAGVRRCVFLECAFMSGATFMKLGRAPAMTNTFDCFMCVCVF